MLGIFIKSEEDTSSKYFSKTSLLVFEREFFNFSINFKQSPAVVPGRFAQATMWNVTLYFHRKHSSVRISLDKVKYVNVTSEKEQECFNTEFELDDATRPSFVKVVLDNVAHRETAVFTVSEITKAIVQNHDLQEMYFGTCGMTFCNETMTALKKLERWTFEITRNDINDDPKSSFYAFYAEFISITFSKNSRTLNTSFFLPTEENRMPDILFSTEGKFGLYKKVKLQNMENYEIYSCIFIFYPNNPEFPHHKCLLTNDSSWKIEMTYESRLIKHLKDIVINLRVTGSEKNSSVILSLDELAYLSACGGFINIPNESVTEIELDFNNNNKPFDITKVVMTKMLTEEEYGCVDIHWTNSRKYTCKVQKGKNWLLKVISPEEHERIFSVEIIQDTLSSFIYHLTWKNFCTYGDSYIKYFNLKTYEDKQITSINLHFDNTSPRINEISLIRNYTEYKFKRNEDSSTHNSSVIRFSRITKEEINFNETVVVNKTEEINSDKTIVVNKTDIINCNKTILIMQIVIGLLAVTILILLVLLIRYLILRRNTNKSSISVCHVTAEDNKCCSTQNTNSSYIHKPGQELCFQKQNSEDYEHIDSKPLITASAEDGSVSYVVQ
eukprot:XP_014786078.1 PREDICTED: uncharacterized protein LOC106880587 [Octopus bimaculoides]